MIPNSDCLIPCWWGITVGVTPWFEAEHALASFALDILLWQTVMAEETDGPHTLETQYVYYPVRGNPKGGVMAITTRDGVVDSLDINPGLTSDAMALSDILATYGKPSIVLVHTVHDIAPFGFPFLLLVFYEDHRFIATYQVEATRDGQNVVACPGSTPPYITIWSPHRSWNDQDIQTYALGPDYYQPLIPLADSTTFTIDALYEISQLQGKSLCLRSPAALWQ
jgi:hypothetical protein